MKIQISRRSFIKNSTIGMLTAAMTGFLPAGKAAGSEKPGQNTGNRNILIAYFSHSGNTGYMAGQIHSQIGGDIFEIKTVNKYSEDYDTVVDQAKREQNMNRT